MGKHFSIRLLWHDRGRDGHVCERPTANVYCIGEYGLKAHGIRDKKDAAAEEAIHGKPWSGIKRLTFKGAANHLRRNRPPGMTQEQIDAVIESIEASLGIRYELEIRETMQSAGGKEAWTAIVATVRRLAYQCFKAPEPWPPIEEDIRLICWMA